MTPITTAHLRELLDSPAQEPVLHLNRHNVPEVGPAAHAPHHRVILTREELYDHLGASGQDEQGRALDWEQFASAHGLTDADLTELIGGPGGYQEEADRIAQEGDV